MFGCWLVLNWLFSFWRQDILDDPVKVRSHGKVHRFTLKINDGSGDEIGVNRDVKEGLLVDIKQTPLGQGFKGLLLGGKGDGERK